MCVGASAPLTALVCEAAGTFAATCERPGVHPAAVGHVAAAPVGMCASQQTDLPMENSRMFWLGRRCAHATTLAQGTPVGEPC